MEPTFVMIKPDGVQRAMVGEIIKRIEARGLTLRAMRMMEISSELAGRHYAEHRDRPFFPELVEFITSGPVVAMVWEGDQAVAAVRQMMGATNPLEAAPGSIRGDLALSLSYNVIHGSDSQESANREIGLFFPELKPI
ncbi:MAG TPA: nucleoside-diphosphate kinase [Syntrophomonadaceae bacterium]|nr:nucleoside-diphosphate kinase [Syntrophomonadaceae bacterium]